MIATMVKEVYGYRELLFALTYRDIRVKYKQAVMGMLWAFFLPVLAIASGTIFRLAMAFFSGKDPQMAHMVAVMVKSVPWILFAGIVGSSSSSLIGNMNLITKIYFPREVIPLSSLLSSLFDFVISFSGLTVLLVVASLFAGDLMDGAVVFSPQLLLVPVFLGTLVVLAAGLGLALSCANLFFRDVKYIVQVLLQFGIFFSLVFFQYDELGSWGWVLLINPVAPLLEGLRMVVVDGTIEPFLWYWLGYSAAVAFIGFYVACEVFEHAEYLFAEFV